MNDDPKVEAARRIQNSLTEMDRLNGWAVNTRRQIISDSKPNETVMVNAQFLANLLQMVIFAASVTTGQMRSDLRIIEGRNVSGKNGAEGGNQGGDPPGGGTSTEL